MRTDKAALNSAMAIVQKILDTILSFVYRTVFIYILGVTYLGVNCLLSNIFSVMSLAELGIGSTIIYLLYEPLTKNNQKEIKGLMRVFARMYTLVGIIILIIGVILMPFLPHLINNNGVKIPDLMPIYVLTLLNTASGYFFAYKRSLFEADQKGYYSTINISVFNVINNIVKIIVLVLTKNFILTLVFSLIIIFCSNIDISIRANKHYPYLNDKSKIKLSKEKMKIIFKRMRAVFIHNISNVVLTGTDNLIISKFIDIVAVGIYSNYTLITNTLYGIFTMIFVSITSSVGNMKVTESNEKSRMIFDRLLLANFYFYFVTSAVLWSCLSTFIKIWIGDSYILNSYITIMVILNLYISGMRHVPVTFVNASGLNYNTRYKSIIEAILNLIISLILVKYIGMLGVLMGTAISLLTCSVIVEPYVLYKHWFKTSPTKYYIKYLLFLLFTFIVSLISGTICNFVLINNFGGLVLKFAISFAISNIIFILVFHNNVDFKFYYTYLISVMLEME